MHTPQIDLEPDQLAHALHFTHAKAAAILRALRTHDKLLEALEPAFERWYAVPRNIEKIEPRWVELSRAAIREAKGE